MMCVYQRRSSQRRGKTSKTSFSIITIPLKRIHKMSYRCHLETFPQNSQGPSLSEPCGYWIQPWSKKLSIHFLDFKDHLHSVIDHYLLILNLIFNLNTNLGTMKPSAVTPNHPWIPRLTLIFRIASKYKNGQWDLLITAVVPPGQPGQSRQVLQSWLFCFIFSTVGVQQNFYPLHKPWPHCSLIY